MLLILLYSILAGKVVMAHKHACTLMYTRTHTHAHTHTRTHTHTLQGQLESPDGWGFGEGIAPPSLRAFMTALDEKFINAVQVCVCVCSCVCLCLCVCVCVCAGVRCNAVMLVNAELVNGLDFGYVPLPHRITSSPYLFFPLVGFTATLLLKRNIPFACCSPYQHLQAPKLSDLKFPPSRF